jgi:rsbT antagonist protein RsbS
MPVPILRQGRNLIAALQSELTDSTWAGLAELLLRRATEARSKGLVVDVSRMEVVDSYAGRTLSNIAKMMKLRGVATVVVGIQPDVAMAMVQLGLHLEGAQTSLDLDEALALLAEQHRGGHERAQR